MELVVHTVESARNVLHLSKPMMYQLLHERKLRGVKAGRHWRISHDALKDFLNGGGGSRSEEVLRVK